MRKKNILNLGWLKAFILGIFLASGSVEAHEDLTLPGLEFGDFVRVATVKTVAALPAKMALSQGSLEEVLMGCVLEGVAGCVGSYASTESGRSFHAGNMDAFTHKLTHGAVGATTAFITGGDPLSGAAGAIVGEMVASSYREGLFGSTPLDPSSPTYQDQMAYGLKIAKLATAVSVGIAGGDIDAAVTAADNAARYNAMAIIPLALAAGAEFVAGLTITEATVAVAAGTATVALGMEAHDQIAEALGGPNTSSSSSTFGSERAPFGNAQNTASCLYVSPAPQREPLPGFTPHYAGPSIFSTPLAPSLRQLPGFMPVAQGPSVFSTPQAPQLAALPGFVGHEGPRASILFQDASPMERSLRKTAQKVQAPHDVSASDLRPLRPIESPYYSNGCTVRMPEEALSRGRPHHNQIGNEYLHGTFEADPSFAQAMEREYPGIVQGVKPGPRGAFSIKAPTQTLTWHHYAYEGGVLELMEKAHHTAPGPIQKNLHPYPNGGGGHSKFSKKGD